VFFGAYVKGELALGLKHSRCGRGQNGVNRLPEIRGAGRDTEQFAQVAELAVDVAAHGDSPFNYTLAGSKVLGNLDILCP